VPAPPPPPAPPSPQFSGYPARQTTNGLAVASLVLGIVGPVFCVAWILALVFGYVARGQIDRSGGTQSGRGMATAGIVLGWVWLGLLVVYIVIAIAAAAGSS
jgi:hypothetical protein